MGLKTPEESLSGLRALPLANLQGLHDDWVKELEKPLEQRCFNKSGARMEDSSCQAFINLFKILIKEKTNGNKNS